MDTTSSGKGKEKEVTKKPSSGDIFIIVLGPSGSGKTSFIDLCCGSNRCQFGTTQSITEAVFEYDGRKVHLIDTPGFDQSGIRSSWVLFQIAFFLAAAYKNGISINGFVYVQGFTQETLDGYFEYPGTLASPSLEMLSMMVGAGKQSHIVLATSPRYLSRGQDWGAAQRQFLLMKWKSVMGKGSQIFDLDRSRSAALPVVSWFASQQQLPGPLRIQCELVDWHQVICLTGFGTRLIRLWKNSHLQLNHVFDVNEFCLDPLYAGNHAKEIEGTKQRTDSTQGEHRTRNMWWHFSRMLKLASPPTGEGIDALQSNLGYIVDQEAHITGLWEDWLLQSLQGSVIDQSGRPKDYRADSVGSFLSYEKPTIEEIVLPVGADNVKSPDLSSDTSSDEGDESTGLKSRIAQNQNRISAQAFPPPRYAAKSFSAERRVTGSNPHTNHTQRMDVRAKLYQCSLLGLKGHAGPNISAENIGRIGKAVTEADLEDIKVDKIATSFESLFGKPLNVATKRFPEHKFPLLLYAWFCREVIICQNMAILVYDNFKRLQNAHLAGTYISIVVARENFENIASTMVADLNRLEFEWVDELVSAFMDCIDALREQCHQFRPKYPWDELRKTEVICTSLLEEIDLGKRSDTTETLLFREIDNDETQELSVHIEIWRRTLGILDLAILAYEGAHTTDFTQQLLGDNCDTIILYETSPLSGTPGEVQSGTGLQLRRQKMKCLAEFFEGRDVWVFGRFSSQDLRSSYLSADIVTFADVWGPVWKVMDKTTEKVVTRYNVGGGSIVPWPYNPDIHPYLKPNERLCHWQSNAAAISFKKAGSSNTSSSSSFSDTDEGEEAGSEFGSFSDKARLMIGADSIPRMQWKKCHCRIDHLVQHLKDAGRLDHIIASKSYRYVDSQQTSLVVGSHGFQAGQAKTTKDKREENLKTSILDRWVNEPHSRDPREFENLWGVVVSLCTMNSRRVRLVEILGDDSVVALLRQFPWSDLSPDGSTSHLRDQYLEAVYSADPRALGDLWDTHPSWREELGKAILSCLKILVLTGFNENREEFYMLWLPPRCRGPRRITLKSTDQAWVKFLKDTTYSVTVAVAVEDSLTGKSHRRKCKHSRPRWFQSPSLLETAICVNSALEPTPKLVKIPSSQGENQDSWPIDLREWRAIWDISALDIGEQFWMGSQTRVRVAAVPTTWHLLLEIDIVKRQILREMLGLKTSEKTGHWEYTDAEAEAVDVRPIPVHITS